MKRTLLLFLATLAGCAPLPPLVTDDSGTENQERSKSPFVAIAPDSDTKTKDSAETYSSRESRTPAILDSASTDSLAPEGEEFYADSAEEAEAFQADTFKITEENLDSIDIPEELKRNFRVGILIGISKADLNADSFLVSTNPDSTSAILVQDSAGIKYKNGKITWSSKDTNFTADSIWVFPAGESKVSIERKIYRGNLLIVSTPQKINVINEVSIEDYLKGVVPYEIGKLDSASIEALKAQAIAARTYAYRHFKSRASLGFDVFASVQDQVYNGATGEGVYSNAAVDSTTGIVLIYNDKFIEAYYHSTCGGRTEGVEAWGLPACPYLKSVKDFKTPKETWCGASSYSSWNRKFKDKELARLFKANFKDAKAKGKNVFSKIKSIEVKSKLPGGRINVLEVTTDKGTFSVKGDKTRWLFKQGSTILPSAKLRIEKKGTAWILHGSGFGHGIGMCQMGARARAKAGQSYKEILLTYYPGVSLKCIRQTP
ncbi:MAG: SpoIID/LytB domain-containing protein [Fibrobacteraceae bacterium]